MTYLIIFLIVWLLGIPVAYFTTTKKWESNSKFERIYFACVWPLLLPLYVIHYIHNKL